MAGSSTAERRPPSSSTSARPPAYVAAERALQTTRASSGSRCSPASCRAPRAGRRSAAPRSATSRWRRSSARAAEQGLQPLRWPDPFPFDSLLAMRVATYAKQIGRTVAFALAAFRQAFAGGRVLARARQRADRGGGVRDAPGRGAQGGASCAAWREQRSSARDAPRATSRLGVRDVRGRVGRRRAVARRARCGPRRAYRLVVRRGGPHARRCSAAPERVDHVEIVDIDERRDRPVLGPAAARPAVATSCAPTSAMSARVLGAGLARATDVDVHRRLRRRVRAS